MPTAPEALRLIETHCLRPDLATYDPYDIWKTRLGFWAKDLFNRSRLLGTTPAALLTIFDLYLNNRRRAFYKPQEYAIVRAWAALILLNSSGHGTSPWSSHVRSHLEWLRDNTCHGYSGACWGLGFRYAVSRNLVYDANMPLSTMTPYALEAFVRYTEFTNDSRFVPLIRSIYSFLREDLHVMRETPHQILISYAAMPDRRVVNAQSYVLYSLALLLPYLSDADRHVETTRIQKLFSYIAHSQMPDGSWLYSEDGRPFIDCFHTCIVLKNLEKARRIVSLPSASSIIDNGYDYLIHRLRDPASFLFRRFSVRNKPSLIKFDLYDNAEALNIATLLGDHSTVETLEPAIRRHFVHEDRIYSQIDIFGRRCNANMLRWAVMPYLYALSRLPST